MPCAVESSMMPAARRLMAPRTRIIDMLQKENSAVGRNINTASKKPALSPNRPSMISAKLPMTLDPEIYHPVHDEITDTHPCAGGCERHLGQFLMPDAAVEIRRDELDQTEDADRKRGE